CEFTAEKCILELPRICNNCLHEILKDKFLSWGSGNELIDGFIQTTQLLSIWTISRMGFIQLFVPNGTDWQIGEELVHTCKVALKKLKGEMKITEAFLSEVQAQFDFCHFAPPSLITIEKWMSYYYRVGQFHKVIILDLNAPGCEQSEENLTAENQSMKLEVTI
ncbi:16301_t:CDS:2, partial [Rhizophagus irregularis]